MLDIVVNTLSHLIERFHIFRESYNTRSIRTLALTLLLVAGLPISVFLVGKQTGLFSRASELPSIEAENGINKTGSVYVGADANASAGNFIQFAGNRPITTISATNTPTPQSVQKNTKTMLGVAIDNRSNFNDSRTESTMKQYGFSLLAMGSDLKPTIVLWGLNRNNFMNTSLWNFTDADTMVAVAQGNGMKVHGHTLVWHSNNPTWMNDLSDSELRSFLQLYVSTLTSHYCGKIESLDVVNEAFQDDGSTLPSGIWREGGDYYISMWNKAFGGNSYIKQSFEWAHAACPSMKLYLNDFNAEEQNAKSNGIYNYIKTMRAQGVPIDGYGMQMHQGNISGQFEYGFANPTSVAANMKRFADIGVLVRISEFDQLLDNHRSETLQNQAKRAGELAAVCYNASNCTSFTVWGMADGFSWYNGIRPQPSDGLGYTPLLFDTNFQPKANYWAVKEALHL